MRRLRRPSVGVASGEHVLASAPLTGGEDLVAGTREALYVAGERLPWERVRSAGWDQESETLTVLDTAGGVRRVGLDNPTRLLQLVRERVTASVVVQRDVALPVGAARIVARRAGGGAREITWTVDYDGPADPDDPAVVALVQAALDSAKDDLGTP